MLLPGARSVLVVGSSGRRLWERFTAWLAADPSERLLGEPNPLDRYVATLLDEGSALLEAAGVRARRFEPTLQARPQLDFRRIAELAGLGSPSPIGLIVHPTHGPWWATRGAWLVDGEIDPTPPVSGPCPTCSAPCVRDLPAGAAFTLLAATRAAREACPLTADRYTDEQLDYHYAPIDDRARLLARYATPRVG